MATPLVKIYPSAINCWQLSVPGDDQQDRRERIAEFFKDTVFPAAHIDDAELSKLKFASADGAVKQRSPFRGEALNDEQPVTVQFWAPEQARSIPWPFGPTDSVSLLQTLQPTVVDPNRVVNLPGGHSTFLDQPVSALDVASGDSVGAGGFLDWSLTAASEDDVIEDNVRAIHTYMQKASPKTLAAKNTRTETLRWFDDLGFTDWDDQSTLDKARTLRNRYDLENTTTPEEKRVVQQRFETGYTFEETQGKGRPVINPETGEVNKPKTSPLVTAAYALGAGAAVFMLRDLFKSKRTAVKP